MQQTREIELGFGFVERLVQKSLFQISAPNYLPGIFDRTSTDFDP